jgi:hypothetical protein
LRTLIHHNKRLFVLLFALGAASAACALLLWHRMQTMSSTSYLWLIKPNLALAWVPLLAATAIRLIWTVRRRLTWTMLPWERSSAIPCRRWQSPPPSASSGCSCCL